jgi:hypothetical protein
MGKGNTLTSYLASEIITVSRAFGGGKDKEREQKGANDDHIVA